MSTNEQPTTSLASNRLSIVPSIGVYSGSGDHYELRGRAGVTVSTITCFPEETDTEPSLGAWYTTNTTLVVTMGPDDCGPRSGAAGPFESTKVAVGKHRMMVSDTALLAGVDGHTSWGRSGEKRDCMLVWRWDYADIDQIYVGRIRKLFMMFDAELILTCRNPDALLHFSAYGSDGGVSGAHGDTAKAAKRDGSNLLGFAHTLAGAVAAHRGCAVSHRSHGSSKEPEDTFTFG